MSTRSGRVGDLLAASSIERLGGMPAIVRTDGCDIVANYRNQWYRVEVKASAKIKDNRTSYQFITSYGRTTKQIMTADKIDIFALVALDIRLCYFVHVSEVQARTKRIAARLFSPAAEKETWLQAISRVQRSTDEHHIID